VRVLVADDQRFWQERLRELLAGWGYGVHCVADGAEALQALEDDPEIAIVVTDWMMPRVDGLELCRRLRERERPRYLPIILLTSRDDPGDLSEALTAGADAFLRKPFHEPELRAQMDVVERILRLEQRLDARISELTRAQARIEADLVAAAKVQESLLPAVAPAVPGMEFAWFYRASDRLGGDFFDVFRLDEEHVGAYVLDVSGHGVPAALHAVRLSQALCPFPGRGGVLRRKALHGRGVRLATPAEVASELNRRFPLIAQSGRYFTFLYAVLELATQRLRFVRAGHPGPVRIGRAGAWVHEDGGGVPIGVVDDPRYRDEEIRLEAGDSLLLCTDGVLETANERGEEFGIARLLEAVSRAPYEGIRRTVDGLCAGLEQFRKGEPQRDDVTILGLSTT
jgi:sigma-B regulation protein RsbU (phosphoserine phosphatase)